LRKKKNVFIIKMTVVCLTVKSSFPLSQPTQLHRSLKNQTAFSERNTMSEERPNAHMIFFPTELYMGLIKKMAAYEIGKSAAILDCLNESLFREGFINAETYEKFRSQYRKKLVDVVKEKEKATVKEQRDIEKLQKLFVMVSEQWDTLQPKARQYHVKKAIELKDLIPEAKEILRKAGILNE